MLLLFTLLMFFISISVPIGISLGLSTLITILLTTDIPTVMITQNAFAALDSFPLLAIPFFIFAGELMAKGGISRRIIDFCNAVVGQVIGALGTITILACTFFAAISGSGPATVSAIGSMMIPDMQGSGYDGYYSAALTCAGGIIGVIIPPSIPFVLYGIITGCSIGEIFLAGFIPGFIIAVAIIALNTWTSKKRGYGIIEVKNPTIKRKGILKSFIDSFWALLTPIIILGGIYSGIFTPTESAIVASFYAIIAGIFIYRELTLGVLIEVIRNTALTNAVSLFNIALSLAFASYITLMEIPARIGTIVTNITDSPFVILLLVNVILLVVGCFIDNISSMTILTPILYPIVVNYCGVDPIHFGVFMTLTLAIGFITPPYGANLFIAAGVTGLKLEGIINEILPFIIVLLVCLLLITYIPSLSMLLPNFFYH